MADVIPLAPNDGLFRNRTTGDVVLLVAGTIIQTWKSTGDIDLVANEARGDVLRHNGTQWERISAKTAAQVIAGDGTDPVSADIGGDVAAAMNAGTLELSVEDLSLASQERGDLARMGASAWEIVAAKTAGAMVMGDGTDVVSQAMSSEGALDGTGAFTAKHPVLLHLRCPAASGIDTDALNGGLAGMDNAADITQTQAGSGFCKVWDNNAPTNTEQASAFCKVEDQNQRTEASATYCKVLDKSYSVGAGATYVKQYDDSATTYYNLEDGNSGDHVQWQLFPNNIQNGDYLYFGHTEEFEEFSLDMSATIQTYLDDACEWEYWDGDTWEPLTITDGTNPTDPTGAQPFTQDGAITFTAPGDWATTSVDSVSAYWVRCKPSTASNIAQIGITNSSRHTIVLADVYANIEDAGAKDFTQWALLPANTQANDAVHFGSASQFEKIYIDISATNQTYTGDGTTYEYWNGAAWSALTVTDGTDAAAGDGKRTCTQDGYISFTAPGDWATTSVGGVSAYWIRAKVVTAGNISQVGITSSVRHYTVLENQFANLDDVTAGQFVQWQLFPNVLEADDRVYFGAAAKFGEIYIDISATNQTYTGDGTSWEYWDGDTWEALTVADTTDAVGGDGLRSFTQDGYVSFTQPGDWASSDIDSQTAYWIRCKITTAANVSQTGITDSHRHYTTVRGLFEDIETASANDFVQWALLPSNTEDDDACYFGAAVPFCQLYFNVSATVQTYTNDATTWEYWNGAAWSTLTLAHDYTDATAQDGKRSFGRDGSLQFVPPADWAAVEVDGQSAYWIRCNAGTAANISQVGLLDSVRQYVCSPADGYTVPHDCNITAIAIRDEAATVHTTADIKFILMNFTTGAHSGELTFAQDKRGDKWTSLDLDVSADDVLGVLVTQEDGTNEMGPFDLEIFADYT